MKKFFKKYLFKKNFALINYNYPEKKIIFDIIKKTEPRLHLRSEEAYQLFVTVRDICKKRKGNLAEVGCFRGGSTKLICESKGSNPFYVFDTFEGIPDVSPIDISSKKYECSFKKGQFCASYEDTKNYLRTYPNVVLVKGIFPDSVSGEIKKKKFIFVHLDVDVYKSTIDSLEFFYNRMEKGAILLSHDYSTAKGVRSAFDEFFRDKPETIIELAGTQCMFVKL